ncbi:hypothetical protein KUTeg_008290 [Tegillarca granosa]|uniref:RNA-polymerase II-associated protein 3-like C-terminal domain-containing protein n=1 Tax=Tegillarca granosa TaxID=220873 RepID=A0ABQ9F8P7_TEGGR|nr:hypothetical protein KUTeg_008290 [Tegillarca granosa]
MIYTYANFFRQITFTKKKLNVHVFSKYYAAIPVLIKHIKGYENLSFHVRLSTCAHVITPLTVSKSVDQVESKSTRLGFNDILNVKLYIDIPERNKNNTVIQNRAVFLTFLISRFNLTASKLGYQKQKIFPEKLKMGETAKLGADNLIFESSTTKKYDIPLSHLDYEYVKKCTNVKEIEKILRVLSRVLRKDKPIMRTSDIDREERQEIQKELEGWHSDMKTTEEMLGHDDEDEDDLPPVRSCNATLNMQGKQESTTIQPEVSNKRVKPRDYREWDKIDIDKELENIDKEEERKPITKTSTKPADIQDYIDTKGMTDEEKELKANREKDKGNEAFRAGDHEEAILEPDNIKALLRRGSAYKGKKEFNKAQIDFEKVLELEPNNKRAKDLLDELAKATKKAEKERKERKEKGRRMVIEEVEGDTEEEEEECQSIEVEQDKSALKSVNGKSGDGKKDSNDEDRKKMNGDASDKPLVNGNMIKNESKTTENVETEKSDILQSDLQKLAKNCENESQSQKELKCGDKLSNEGDKNMQYLGTNSNHMISEKEQIEKHNNQNNHVVQSDGKNSMLEAKENEQNEQVEKVKENSDRQNAEKVSNEHVGENEESEALSLRRPIFIQKKLPDNVSLLREEGNNLFRTGQYSEAVNKYTKADQLVNLSLIHSNRAACYLKTGDCPAAIKDCTTALDLVPHSVKPLLRRASAYEHIERYRMAYVDYKHVLHIDRFADMAHQGSSRCQGHLQQNDGPKWREKLPPLKSVMPWEIPEIVDENDPTSKSIPITIEATSSQPLENNQESRESEQPKPEQKQPEPPKQQQKESEPPKKPVPEQKQPEPPIQQKKQEISVKQLHYTVSPSDAEVDCTKALTMEPENGTSQKMLKRYKDSLEDLTHLIKELNSLKKQMPNKSESAKSQPEKQKTNTSGEKKQRKRMVIQEVESDSDEEEEQIPKKAEMTQPTTNKTEKQTKKSSQNKSSNKRNSTGAAKTVKTMVISNKLDGQMLNMITKCVAEKFVPEGDIDTGYKILYNLCKVPRFQTIAMFLSNAEKKDIQTVFKTLQTTKSDCYSNDDLVKLKKEYGIK